MINITVESSFYDSDSEQLKITDFYATRLTRYAIDIHIDFKQPESISVSQLEPDQLKLNFTLGKIFMESVDFTELKQDL